MLILEKLKRLKKNKYTRIIQKYFFFYIFYIKRNHYKTFINFLDQFIYLFNFLFILHFKEQKAVITVRIFHFVNFLIPNYNFFYERSINLCNIFLFNLNINNYLSNYYIKCYV